MSSDKIQYLIIGAGPAGLAIAGRMRTAGLPFTIIEQADCVAHRWHGHYDRVHLHTVKRWSHLPHLPFPDDYPIYVPKDKLIAYFENYAAHFKIVPEFDVEVESIERMDGQYWKVRTSQRVIYAEHVIVATGVNRVPNIPVWKGSEEFAGTIVHSVDYLNPKPYLGSRTLVIGMGNTGAEIALDLAEADVATWLSVRGSVNIVPRDLNGRPVQETSKFLARLPFGDWLGARVQRLYFGDLSKYGLQVSKLPPAVELRTTGKTPVIDIGTVNAIKDGRIQVVGEVVKTTTNGVVLDSGEELMFEHIILATGYRSRLDELITGVGPFLDQNGCPLGPVGTGTCDGLYFIGFDNYKLGGILGTIHADSETIVRHLIEKEK